MNPKTLAESVSIIREVSRHGQDYRVIEVQDAVECLCKYIDEKMILAEENTCICGGLCKKQVYPVGTEKILGVPEEKPEIKYCIRAFEGAESEWGASIIETPLEVGDIGHSSGVISFVEPVEIKKDRKFREKVVPMFKEIFAAIKNRECINWTSYVHDFHAAICELEDNGEG